MAANFRLSVAFAVIGFGRLTLSYVCGFYCCFTSAFDSFNCYFLRVETKFNRNAGFDNETQYHTEMKEKEEKEKIIIELKKKF